MSLDSKNTAKEMWDHLATTYGAPMAVSAYTDFLHLMKLRINPSDDLGSKLAEFNMVLGVLATQQLAIAEPLQCMILCGAFSDKWGQGPMNILSLVQAKDLKINDIIACLKELSSHHTGQSNLPKLESRIQATSSELFYHVPEESQECSEEYDQQYDQEETGQYSNQYDDYEEGYESYNVKVTALDINTANRFKEFKEEITPVPVYNAEPVDQLSLSLVTTEYSHSQWNSNSGGDQ
ncbi:hypothetical protein PISMIDRAFT_14377 [Pisolithus microcarpus 441]|uniref:Unplaced genomic scaffold scaffold_122, whole genome shotgun sequence n=1 Tax=Pisolithus microcarpus 441 TaxID=765257 RepID=A0A0C9YWU5_9AGAM|nr:hypothetical protein PISMIDRAFT_14377 [Pisolithus microcarpus 441]